MSMEQLRHLAEQAKSGPWYAVHSIEVGYGAQALCYKWEVRGSDNAPTDKHSWPERIAASVPGQYTPQADANADYIAAANPTAILALLSELDILSAKNKALAERVAGLEQGLREIATFGAGYGFSAPTDIATFCQRRARTLITGADAMLAARTQESSK